ncbi:coenzyme Q biosynthesis Coq4 family protein [Actinidia rufa]|uniref:Coenzyme Q biosynthesis Coq4 family protein n=1 Tax=Actinidia rufa TaxID=165716 RepID=A0A7J0G2K9_9ERIC|nr:coenzyme Q biosynthesis Coq4 family protein [Actinidia rufa]
MTQDDLDHLRESCFIPSSIQINFPRRVKLLVLLTQTRWPSMRPPFMPVLPPYSPYNQDDLAILQHLACSALFPTHAECRPQRVRYCGELLNTPFPFPSLGTCLVLTKTLSPIMDGYTSRSFGFPKSMASGEGNNGKDRPADGTSASSGDAGVQGENLRPILGFVSSSSSSNSDSRSESWFSCGRIVGSTKSGSNSCKAVLLERPRVVSLKVGHAWDLPDNTFGAAYARFMGSRNFSPDDRLPIRFMETDELAYVALCFQSREVHDFWHTLFGLPTNLICESTLKHYFPWAIRAGMRSADLISIYYEHHFHEDLVVVCRRWGIIPASPPPT